VRVVAIVQARMGSTRLPGKVLRRIGTRTMLARVVERTQRASMLDEVVVATTTGADDEAIVAECRRLGVPVFRGKEQDVLDRYWQAARAHQAQMVVRITSDCPLIEPEVIDRVVDAFLHVAPDYASNTLERSYPRGLDTEAVGLAALERAWHEATEAYQRVHVTPYLYQHPELFRLLSVTGDVDRSDYRWTVDTLEDLAFVREVYERLGDDGTIGWMEVLDLLVHEPDLAELNRPVQQKALQDG
jgi:spore coat polysaccharide biosynthesis protein SpsF